MKPFRKHAAIAIDGGGLRGVMVTTALEALEKELGKKLGDIFEMAVGTSTGSIIAAGIAMNLSAAEMTARYREMAPKVFAPSLRQRLWFLFNYRYSNEPIRQALDAQTHGAKMGDLWTDARKFDLVITARDLNQARMRFLKSWKPEYKDMPITTAALASAAAPTYFPVVDGRFVDGGVGSFGNPCYLAAYEACFYLKWKMEETTLISLGTGRPKPDTEVLPLHEPDHYRPLDWLPKLLDAFMDDANDQQAGVVAKFFPGLDFRRFQIVTDAIALDDLSKMDYLADFGVKFGDMILNDQYQDYSEQQMAAVPNQ